MAELNVEPKKKNHWWVWLLVALIALALLFFLLKGGNDNKQLAALNDTTEANVNAALTTGNPDDWSALDRNAPVASYEEVTDKDISVRGNDEYAIYSLEETLLFDAGQSTIRAEAEDKLEQIAASAERRFAGGGLRVYGFTDSRGSENNNKKLSEERAQNVQKWLVQKGNISQDRISIEAEGEANARSSNATAEGRAANRRVEVVVRKK